MASRLIRRRTTLWSYAMGLTAPVWVTMICEGLVFLATLCALAGLCVVIDAFQH